MYNNRTYATVDTVAFTNALTSGQISASLLFENVIETSMDTLRYSLDSTQFVIKTASQASIDYLEAKAAEFSIPYTLYDHEEILNLMSTEAWSSSAMI